MKKSQEKKTDIYDLELHWSPVTPNSVNRVEEHTSGPRRVEEYLDFLEEVALPQRDDRPVKIYKERFSL
jgi:hypothetical protein